MTAQPAAGSLAAGFLAAYRLPPLPDPPKKRDMHKAFTSTAPPS